MDSTSFSNETTSKGNSVLKLLKYPHIQGAIGAIIERISYLTLGLTKIKGKLPNSLFMNLQIALLKSCLDQILNFEINRHAEKLKLRLNFNTGLALI
jgi:hypothetical protein